MTATAARGEILTTAEVSALTKIPAPTLRRWRHERTGPRSFSLGRLTRYYRNDVDAWLDEQYEATHRVLTD